MNSRDYMLLQCEECGGEDLEKYGSGDDELGEFEDYECMECYSITRNYTDE